MYVFAFPLLLLLASTICASPVRPFDITQELRKSFRIDTHPYRWVHNLFYDKTSEPIAEWSDSSDTVVIPDYTKRGRIMIKKVDLKMVQADPGLTYEDDTITPQLQQTFIEINALQTAGKLEGYYRTLDYVYIAIDIRGLPESRCGLTEKEKEMSRDNGIRAILEHSQLALDDAHKGYKYFAFRRPVAHVFVADPLMLRYAKRVQT